MKTLIIPINSSLLKLNVLLKIITKQKQCYLVNISQRGLVKLLITEIKHEQ
ncbi:hypothetical protein XBI1_790002 [Xenorhabdus bovienii str. Intermedium]|uniref:Uncharacterized protein n=1 Tax=Xenorhabdus bovienii str. Intermedium TaxID=1379677 RepID=A0A077QNE0_XENBV|nr:hypothetical protein XBI1_790002 [Xenorhabdus bovienii str. Intermedium]